MSDKAKNNGIWIIFAVGALVLIVLAGYRLATNQRFGENASLKQIVNSASTWGPEYISMYGKPAPDFTLTDLDGTKHSLSDYRGKNVMMVFWASWCWPCKTEIPNLIKLQNMIEKENLPWQILAITNDSPDTVREIVTKARINYTVLLENNDMPEPYGVDRLYNSTGIPGSFFVDPQGNIKLATVGLLKFRDMKGVLKAKPDPEL